LPFKAYEKLDGSLGVGYWIDGKLHIATKGSFESDQAIKANEILDKKYPNISEKLNSNYTYLFEIIYPENRIVVNYGDIEDVVLIGVKDTATGEDIPNIDYYKLYGMSVVQEYDAADWKTMREQFSGDNREGFVVRFSNGFRMKMKYEDYFKKHFLKSYLTEKHVFLFYEEGRLDELNDIVNNMDEENQITVARMLKKFDMHRDRIRKTAHEEFEKMGYPLGTVMDKESAARIHKECKYSTMVFRLIRGLDIEIDVMRVLHKEIKFLEDEE
jgi:RNA ligase